MISREQIRAGRALIDWSAKDLAEAAGVSLNTVQRIENGKLENASVATVEKIRRALEGGGVILLDDGYGVTKRPPKTL